MKHELYLQKYILLTDATNPQTKVHESGEIGST